MKDYLNHNYNHYLLSDLSESAVIGGGTTVRQEIGGLWDDCVHRTQSWLLVDLFTDGMLSKL